MSRIRYSVEVRQDAISRVIHSHTPIAQVARDLGCTAGTLHSWLKKHQAQTVSVGAPPEAAFVPIKITDSPSHSVEIVLPNGIMIRLSDASPQYLAELVLALAPSC